MPQSSQPWPRAAWARAQLHPLTVGSWDESLPGTANCQVLCLVKLPTQLKACYRARVDGQRCGEDTDSQIRASDPPCERPRFSGVVIARARKDRVRTPNDVRS